MAKSEKRSLAAIEAEIEKLKREAAALRAAEVAEVVGKIKSAIEAYGLTAADLGLAPKAGRKPKGTAATRPGRRAAGGGARKKASARPPKYADGNGNSWVGQGKRPGWFVAALAAGKTPEELLVKTGG